MQIRVLSLEDFRVYREALLQFEARTTVIVGDNAQGKTSILEAICALARTKSQRTNRDDELIRWGEDQTIVSGRFERGVRGPVSLRMVMMTPEAARFTGAPQKQFALNDEPINGSRAIIGEITVVVFSPDDLALAKGDPGGRRRFMNVAIGQIQPLHLADAQQYRRALRQRGELLGMIAERRASEDQLNAWDEQVAKHGAEIVKARGKYIRDLAEAAKRIHHELTGGAEELSVEYRSNVWEGDGGEAVALQGTMLQKLDEKRPQEINLRRTLTGPHRDDIQLRVDEKDLRKFGSQGQQRTAVLALRLAEAEVARTRLDETPLVLLDDCLSELDESRAGRVLEQAGDKTQLIITTTHLTE
ncbi:MAG TPA: DNA replication/repair protein RecF, partial [Armatimonadota bacterium]|nr:DNA replication/repair protein RecF [Armatimonadota bacterium]